LTISSHKMQENPAFLWLSAELSALILNNTLSLLRGSI
jgi:hypothetical protein